MARRAVVHLSRTSGPAWLPTLARLIGTSLAYLAVLDTALIVAYALGQSVVPEAARGTFGLVGLGVAEAAALGTVLWIWHAVDRRPVRALGLYRTNAGRQWLRGAAIAALMMGFVVLVGYTLIDGAAWEVNPDPVRAVIVVVAGLGGFLIQGPAEEVFFRGYLIENVRARWGIRWAIVVSSLVFAVSHAPNPGFGVVPFINLVLFGLATALYRVYVDGGQLWGVFAIHSVWNWLQQVVFGLPNSGIASAPSDALFTVTPNTSLPDPVWGGGFGPEGTLLATVVLLALVLYGVRRQNQQRARLATRQRPASVRGAG